MRGSTTPQLREDYDLRALNTFGVPAVAERFLSVTHHGELAALEHPPTLVLGGGSNVLLLDRVPGLTVHNRITGILEADGTGNFVVGGGTDWNQFVRYTLASGYAGLENLILIPGTVGAAPVQNIGAYGAEVAEFISGVHVYEYGKGFTVLPPEACGFGYRDSRFKREPGRYFIHAVGFRLGREPQLRLEYGAIRSELERRRIGKPRPTDVATAVTHIRRSKLPDWFFYGNSGSFFKNPVVERTTYDRLRAAFPDCPAYPIDERHVKLAAGWLIDRAGLRGSRHGAVGSYAGQALVLVNHGGATGTQVLDFSRHVQATVREKFGVSLEREVQVVGS